MGAHAQDSAAVTAITTEVAGQTDTDSIGPWNLGELYQPPQYRWLSRQGAIHSLVYAGEPVLGQPTEVFAFYASPATLGERSKDSKFPGVVLIHGGGGTAFAEWVWLWAKRGYAAIAMDLAGSRPPEPVYDEAGVPKAGLVSKPNSRTRLELGGLDHGPPEKFESIGGETSDDWPYQAVASVIRAHSWLRSFPEVQADRTAVTGISWGGYTTCLVASLDNRFRAAVPVYGCGFLFEGESVQKGAIDRLGPRRQAWIEAYDPSRWLSRCRVPILFVNGTNDQHYPLDSYQRSFDLVPGFKQMRIEVQMRHSHPAGWAPAEIALFIDSYCQDLPPLTLLDSPAVTGEEVRLSYRSPSPLRAAAVHFTSDGGPRTQRTWQSLPARIAEDQIVAPRPPAGANTWFLSATDERGAMVTTSVQFHP
jgi:dienelactone hydrolase